jgi:hypothetical protein
MKLFKVTPRKMKAGEGDALAAGRRFRGSWIRRTGGEKIDAHKSSFFQMF